MYKLEDDFDILMQAFENVGDTYGGATKTLLHSLIREIKRLKRAKERDEHQAQVKRQLELAKARKVTGKDDIDDEIPF